MVRAAAADDSGATVADVLVVDDHPLMCDALSATLGLAFDLRKVRAVSSIAAALASVRDEGAPDAVVLDLNLPDAEGVGGLLALRKAVGAAPIAVISADVEPGVVSAALGVGASGYVSKLLPRARMVDAFRRIWAGETVLPDGFEPEDAEVGEAATLARGFASLTPQQMNILRLICQGRPNKIISYELSIAEATVKTHIAAIMTKINVRNRTQAALLASKARLFTH
ncbi:response regulator transcription factor [Amaricoccus sp.]|uniref:LuxR C-terminal-related transcriptional regulator n=1 Tax=Amaricoccus sp. TaxID=1872485 RepID=UPI001B51AB1C|nr:response regulator transcription factor [Amaricoccus sp.]MBP7243091.1 response regulator transcription factor [Amaricoccus sp.]